MSETNERAKPTVTIGAVNYTPEQIPAEIRRYERLLVKAEADSKKAMNARMALGVGATRARTTTANARWATAAEHRDKLRCHLGALRALVPATPAPQGATQEGYDGE